MGIGVNKDLTLKIGTREDKSQNYNIVSGKGRIFDNGKFVNLCSNGNLDLTTCKINTKRSMGVYTTKGYLILLVNNHRLLEGRKLYLKDMEKLFTNIVTVYNLGNIENGLLFDGGSSPGMYYNGEFIVENDNNIDSVLLVYLLNKQ